MVYISKHILEERGVSDLTKPCILTAEKTSALISYIQTLRVCRATRLFTLSTFNLLPAMKPFIFLITKS